MVDARKIIKTQISMMDEPPTNWTELAGVLKALSVWAATLSMQHAVNLRNDIAYLDSAKIVGEVQFLASAGELQREARRYYLGASMAAIDEPRMLFARDSDLQVELDSVYPSGLVVENFTEQASSMLASRILNQQQTDSPSVQHVNALDNMADIHSKIIDSVNNQLDVILGANEGISFNPDSVVATVKQELPWLPHHVEKTIRSILAL